jgi:hypothetical protein
VATVNQGESPERREFGQPKLVTYPELRRKLEVYTRGWPWAEDAIRDLWLMGAPMPMDKCPGNTPCKAYPSCDHIRRVLIPEAFAKWWAEVGERQAELIGAKEVASKIGDTNS